MTLWMVRAGSEGEQEHEALQRSIAVIGWEDLNLDLSKIRTRDELKETMAKVYPQEKLEVPEGELELPHMYDTVKSLPQVVDVDYVIPGCAPEAHQVWGVLEAVTAALKGDAELPPKGAVIGVAPKTCCDECERSRKRRRSPASGVSGSSSPIPRSACSSRV